MKSSTSTIGLLLLVPVFAQASWYWPFETGAGGDDQPRLSELMEPATTNIDAAADYAAEGKFKEAQASYRAAIAALDAIESDTNNADRVGTPEFATVRNKRAYVNAALDSMLLAEARENAKAVAVTDTTALEVKLSLKPWKEFLPTYEALTNDYRILMGRTAYIEKNAEAHQLLNALTDPSLQAACASNFSGMVSSKAELGARWAAFVSAHDQTAKTVVQMKRFSETTNSRGGVQVFDVCRQDVRKGVAACKEAWPKVGESLGEMNRNLEGLHGLLLDVAAKKDFAVLAKSYAEHVKGRTLKDAETMATDLGYPRAYGMMIDALNEAKWGQVFSGAVVRVEMAWGGATPEVPTKEEDKGLVKDGGDQRPEVTSQIDTYMEKERQHTANVNKKAEKVKADNKTKRAVQAEVATLLKADPKSRKARLLQAGEDLRSGAFAAAKEKVAGLLSEKPNDGAALNMRAAIEAAEGDLKAAEKTLDQAIQSNPRDYHAYYNMANVYLEKGNVDGARRYYETGRSFAGPKDAEMERALTR